jgi:hypothetical protein
VVRSFRGTGRAVAFDQVATDKSPGQVVEWPLIPGFLVVLVRPKVKSSFLVPAFDHEATGAWASVSFADRSDALRTFDDEIDRYFAFGVTRSMVDEMSDKGAASSESDDLQGARCLKLALAVLQADLGRVGKSHLLHLVRISGGKTNSGSGESREEQHAAVVVVFGNSLQNM